MKQARYLTLLTLILTGIVTRFLPHPPNFTAINAIALFGGAYLGRRWISLGVVFVTMFLSDFVLGFHSAMPFVYGSFGLTVLLGHRLNNKRSISVPLYLLASSMLFFVISNFGVWVLGSFYSKTLEGLELCYLAAVPFLRNQILGDLIYGAVMFGALAFAEKTFPAIRSNEGLAA